MSLSLAVLGEARCEDEAVLKVDGPRCLKKGNLGELQGGPSARGLGYVDISSVSYQGYPGTKLMSTKPSPRADGSPCTSPEQQLCQ